MLRAALSVKIVVPSAEFASVALHHRQDAPTHGVVEASSTDARDQSKRRSASRTIVTRSGFATGSADRSRSGGASSGDADQGWRCTISVIAVHPERRAR